MKKQTILLSFILFFLFQFASAQTVTNFGFNSGAKGSHNSFYGYESGKSVLGGSENNVFIGSRTGAQTVHSFYNTFVGSKAGQANTTGNSNTFLGAFSGKENTDGEGNTYLGISSGALNKSGNYNTFVGYYTGLFNKIGFHNTFIGTQAGFKNTSGNFNTYLGVLAGDTNSIGSENTYLGYQAGRRAIGSGNVFIGNKAGYFEGGDNKLYIENSDAKTPLIFGDFASNRVGINTKKTSDNGVNYTLSVNGKVRATEVKVYTNWADYVFDKDYKLKPLAEVELFIAQNQHLPDVPSAAEVEQNGIFVGEMSKIQMQKIEELTLYLLQINQTLMQKDTQIQTLQNKLQLMNDQLLQMQAQINQIKN
jgi:trimeric autotransporter adhesin